MHALMLRHMDAFLPRSCGGRAIPVAILVAIIGEYQESEKVKELWSE